MTREVVLNDLVTSVQFSLPSSTEVIICQTIFFLLTLEVLIFDLIIFVAQGL